MNNIGSPFKISSQVNLKSEDKLSNSQSPSKSSLKDEVTSRANL